MATLGPRPFCPDQVCACRSREPPLLHARHRIWPHEFYYGRRPADHGGDRLFPSHQPSTRMVAAYARPQTGWTDLFRMSSASAHGDPTRSSVSPGALVDRTKLVRRGVNTPVWLTIAAATGGAWIFYFADAPDAWRGTLPAACGLVASYSTVRHSYRRPLRVRRLPARAGLHFTCVPANHPGRDADEKSLTVITRNGGANRAATASKRRHWRISRSATALTATRASPCARPGSTFAKGNRSAASPVPCASTPATKSWPRLAGRAA